MGTKKILKKQEKDLYTCPLPTRVDTNQLSTVVDFLNNALTYLDHISSGILVGRIRPNMPDDIALGTPFGGYPEAREQWSRLEAATNTMTTNIAVVRQQLTKLQSGTQQIITQYNNVEARNAATANQIDSMLDNATSTTSTQSAATNNTAKA
jgi:hypothetical protein